MENIPIALKYPYSLRTVLAVLCLRGIEPLLKRKALVCNEESIN